MAQANVGFAAEEYATGGNNVYRNQPKSLPDYRDNKPIPNNGPGIHVPPPQYENRTNNQFIIINPASNPPDVILRYKKMHLILGTIALVLGVIQMILDPLIPGLYGYPFSMFSGGLFMVISGACSIYGSKINDTCSLIASLTFDILALLNIFASIIVGIIFVILKLGIGFAIFNIIYGIILFVLMIWDSAIKCSDVCCCKRRENTLVYVPTSQVVSMRQN